MASAHEEAMRLIAQAGKFGDDQRQEHLDLVLKAAAIHPHCHDVQQALAFAHWQCGNMLEAVDAQRKVIQMGNDLECPNLIFAHHLAEVRLVEELETHLRERWQKRPDQLFWGRELGYNLMKAGATDRGAAAFREFLAQHPKDNLAVSQFVHRLICADRWSEALEVLNHFGSEAMPAWEYHLQRGDLFAEIGQRDTAEREWELSLAHPCAEIDLAERIQESREYFFEGGRECEEAENSD